MIEVVREHVTVRLNGNAVLSDEPVRDADRYGTVGVSVYNFMPRFSAAVTLADFTLQKLDDEGRTVAGN